MSRNCNRRSRDDCSHEQVLSDHLAAGERNRIPLPVTKKAIGILTKGNAIGRDQHPLFNSSSQCPGYVEDAAVPEMSNDTAGFRADDVHDSSPTESGPNVGIRQ